MDQPPGGRRSVDAVKTLAMRPDTPLPGETRQGLMVVTGSQVELFAMENWFSCLPFVDFIEAVFFSGRGGHGRGLAARSLAGKCADSLQIIKDKNLLYHRDYNTMQFCGRLRWPDPKTNIFPVFMG